MLQGDFSLKPITEDFLFGGDNHKNEITIVMVNFKDTNTICKKWIKSRFLINGDYLSPKLRWTNRFSVVVRTAFKLLIFEEFNHDSCS